MGYRLDLYKGLNSDTKSINILSRILGELVVDQDDPTRVLGSGLIFILGLALEMSRYTWCQSGLLKIGIGPSYRVAKGGFTHVNLRQSYIRRPIVVVNIWDCWYYPTG